MSSPRFLRSWVKYQQNTNSLNNLLITLSDQKVPKVYHLITEQTDIIYPVDLLREMWWENEVELLTKFRALFEYLKMIPRLFFPYVKVRFPNLV